MKAAPRFRSRPGRLLPAALLAALVLLPSGGRAQTGAEDPEVYQISQRATLSQELGGATVSLDYSRPLMRGRDDVFGKVVHWGELWTPGANMATVLEVDEEIKLNGHAVPAGRWSMWIIPSQVGPWELVLDRRDSLFHTERPELTDEQVRFVVDVKHDAPHVEALTWGFPRIDHDGGTLRMNWGTLEIPLEVSTRSLRPKLTLEPAVAEQYVGAWRVAPQLGPSGGQPAPPFTLTVERTPEGLLMAHIPEGVFGPPPAETETAVDEAQLTPQERERLEAKRTLAKLESGAFSYLLVPLAEGIFVMGYADDDGELLETSEFYHEFEFENGRPVRVTFRGEDDRVVAEGVRENR